MFRTATRRAECSVPTRSSPTFGVTTDRPVAFVLPNLPETHFTIWGGEAAGAALAINPMLEPRQIAELMRAARASVLVTLAPALNPKGWSGLVAELASLPDLRTIASVDMADYPDSGTGEAARASIAEAAASSPVKVVNLRHAMREMPFDRLLTDRLTSAPAARPARRRLRPGRIEAKCSTPGPSRRCSPAPS